MTEDQQQHEQHADAPPVTELSSRQRRVLGVMVEKGMTTPEYYPLTLKAVTAGCNQKSNRDPVVNYSEEQVADTLDELRELGLAAVVHTESGRTERYRHYMRRRFTLTEPQLAILTELLLRGRQQLGELRSRAGRMVPIDSLEQLREELTGLEALNLVQASGPLERRGIEVDHTLYRAKEGRALPLADARETAFTGPASEKPVGAAEVTATVSPDAVQRLTALETTVDELRAENRELHSEFETVKEELRDLRDRLDDLRRDLGAS